MEQTLTFPLIPTLLSALVSGEGMVTIEVGPEHTKYEVHKALITKRSEFFRKALDGPWQEADERVVQLVDIDPCAFNVFLGWLYTGAMPKTTSDAWLTAGGCGEIKERRSERAEELRLRSCITGDYLNAPLFLEAANNAYVNQKVKNKSSCSYTHIIDAFDCLPENSPILKLMVDAQCVFWNPKVDDEGEIQLREHLPHDFLVKMLLRSDQLRKMPNIPAWLNPCDYHMHSSDQERKKCAENIPEQSLNLYVNCKGADIDNDHARR